MWTVNCLYTTLFDVWQKLEFRDWSIIVDYNFMGGLIFSFTSEKSGRDKLLVCFQPVCLTAYDSFLLVFVVVALPFSFILAITLTEIMSKSTKTRPKLQWTEIVCMRKNPLWYIHKDRYIFRNYYIW